MPDRKRHVSTVLLISTLALLAAILVAPIRSSEFATVSSRFNCLCRDFALPPSQPATRLNAPTAADVVIQALALPAEKDEQDGADALDEPRLSFLIPFSLRRVPDPQVSTPRSILSLYPLRC